MSIFKGIRKHLVSSRRENPAENKVLPPSNNTVWSEALARWEQVHKLNPQDINARVQIVLSNFHLGNITVADQLIVELLEKFPDNLFVKLAAARHAQRTDNFKIARSRWEKIKNEHPELSEPLISLANIFISESNFDGALELAQQIIDADPNEHHAFIIQGRVHHKMENWDLALTAWHSALEIEETNFEAELMQASALLKIEQYERVLNEADKSIEKHTLKAPFMLLKIRAFAQMNRNTEVINTANDVLKLKNNSIDAIHAKAYALYRMEQYNEAESVCSSAIAINAHDVQMLTLFARIAQAQALHLKAG